MFDTQSHQISEFATGAQAEKRGLKLLIQGKVQGVGFRPFICRLALKFGIQGKVYNDANGVVIEAIGSERQLNSFIKTIEGEAPPSALVRHIHSKPLSHSEFNAKPNGFYAEASTAGTQVDELAADIATCNQCISEILAPDSRRYGYAFNCCADCGPRYSIQRGMPFDRHTTSMRQFPLCTHCQAEYDDIQDRRYLAQTISCSVCGPRLKVYQLQGQSYCEQLVERPIEFLAQSLKSGKILAIKNTGGYQLLAGINHTEQIIKLRQRKKRQSKPFAVLCKDVAMAQQQVKLTPASIRLLKSSSAPIVIAPRRNKGNSGQDVVAPNLQEWGVMLANTPLQHLLFQYLQQPVICTSANLSGGIMVCDDQEALNHLFAFADIVVTHNREIIHRIDDSVYRQFENSHLLIRSGRGLAPVTLEIESDFSDVSNSRSRAILACGADLKANFSLVKGHQILCSPYLADLGHYDALHYYRQLIKDWIDLYRVELKQVTFDRHPDYFSTQHAMSLAQANRLTETAVQHHHAHVAALCVEVGIKVTQPVLAIVMDGLGFGLDGNLWGGECFAGTVGELNRKATIKPTVMPAGELAIKQPWRMLASYLQAAGLDDWSQLDTFKHIDKDVIGGVQQLISQSQPVFTTSAGRIFDAIAVLLGLVNDTVDYDAQAPMLVETLAACSASKDTYSFTVTGQELCSIDFSETWRQSLSALDADSSHNSKCNIAKTWTNTIAAAFFSVVKKIAESEGYSLADTPILFSGGCSQNLVLLSALKSMFDGEKSRFYYHQLLPANDGSISVGQAYLSMVKDSQCV